MVVSPPAHTPYDGSSKPFAIGLKPLDLANWIEIDEHYEAYLAEKHRRFRAMPESVFAEEAGTRKAQREVLDLIADHLVAGMTRLFRGPEQFATFTANMAAAGRLAPSDPPLRAASLLVQEDLVLMRKGEDGWRLAAASLCFPSSWSLAEKFGRPMAEIHKPVPGFGHGTRNADLIERMFDRLQGQAVERMNWSLQDDAELYRPLSDSRRDERATAASPRFPGEDPAAAAFIRVERQTLRKLPRSGDILFTIRIFLDPMRRLALHPDRARLASSFAAQLAALDEAQLDYKGLAADRDRLVASLRGMAAG